MEAASGRVDRSVDRAFRPDPDSGLGRVFLRLCAGVASRAQLVHLLDRERLRDPDVTGGLGCEQLVDAMIAEHNRHVPAASAAAIGMESALELLAARGVVHSFGTAATVDDALREVTAAARALLPTGQLVRGYCYLTTGDVDRLVLTGATSVGYGVFGRTAEGAFEVGAQVCQVLRTSPGLEAQWSRDVADRIRVTGSYRLPFVDCGG